MDVAADGDLLERLASDTAGTFGTFVRAHAGLVYTVALRCSGSRADAEDLAQETFVRAYKALTSYSAERIRELNPRGWLSAIVTNLWRNELRRRSRRPREAPLEDSGLLVPAAPNAEDEALSRFGSRELARTLLGLPEQHRIALVLRHVVGLSYDEIAEALGCPVGTAKTRVHRAASTLRELLEANAPDDEGRRPADAQHGIDLREKEGVRR